MIIDLSRWLAPRTLLALLGVASLAACARPDPAPIPVAPQIRAERRELEQRRRWQYGTRFHATLWLEEHAPLKAPADPDSLRADRAKFIEACLPCASAPKCEEEARQLELNPLVARYWTSCP